jgi:hypothetical protein
MTHCPTDDVLLDYTAGCLDPAKMALFERHADQCAHCAALRTAQAAVWRSMDEWKPVTVSVGFNRELWRRIDAEARTSSWTSRSLAGLMQFSLWKRVAPLAVAMVLVVTAFVMDFSNRPQPGMPVAATAASIVVTVSDADQIERALDDIQLLDEVNAASEAAKPASDLI